MIEGLGIKKTFEKMEQAQVVVFLLEAQKFISMEDALRVEIQKIRNKYPQKAVLIIVNKSDLISGNERKKIETDLKEISGESEKSHALLLSAKTGEGVETLKSTLLELVNTGALRNNETIVTNTRHYDALLKALEEIDKVQQGLDNNLSGDLLAVDIRQALYYFGEITGEITNDELLGNIFANFCIGK